MPSSKVSIERPASTHAWTSVARKYWERAGVAHKVDLKLGPAVESLEGLIADGRAGAIDMIFIDADKGNYWRYWNLGLELLRTGGLIVADHTLFQGMVEPSIGDEEIRSRFADRGADRSESIVRSTHHLREFNRLVAMDTRVALSMVPVGDGMTLGVKRAVLLTHRAVRTCPDRRSPSRIA
jgi:caffeoyl-CoA O-methyltransferase